MHAAPKPTRVNQKFENENHKICYTSNVIVAGGFSLLKTVNMCLIIGDKLGFPCVCVKDWVIKLSAEISKSTGKFRWGLVISLLNTEAIICYSYVGKFSKVI